MVELSRPLPPMTNFGTIGAILSLDLDRGTLTWLSERLLSAISLRYGGNGSGFYFHPTKHIAEERYPSMGWCGTAIANSMMDRLSARCRKWGLLHLDEWFQLFKNLVQIQLRKKKKLRISAWAVRRCECWYEDEAFLEPCEVPTIKYWSRETRSSIRYVFGRQNREAPCTICLSF